VKKKYGSKEKQMSGRETSGVLARQGAVGSLDRGDPERKQKKKKMVLDESVEREHGEGTRAPGRPSRKKELHKIERRKPSWSLKSSVENDRTTSEHRFPCVGTARKVQDSGWGHAPEDDRRN